jgi:hypothetical protein
MKTVRKIARSVLPFQLRCKIRKVVFKDFRRLKILDFLRSVGFLTYQSYIEVNAFNVERVFNKENGQIKIYTMGEENEIKAAVHLEGQELNGMQPFLATTETLLLDIRDSGFSFRNNHLLDKDLNVIGEQRTEELNKFLPLPIYSEVISKATKLEGTVAYLSDPDPANYYHWMCRTLPLLRIYQKWFDWQEIDFFYIGQFPISSFHKESLEKAGIPLNKITQSACTADRILVAITNRTINWGDPINKEAYFFTRNLFLKNLKINFKNKKSRVYVKRGNPGRRKVINEIQVIALLERYGFASVLMDDKTVQEQAEIFSQAEAIVAAHGAALTNLLFIQARTKVIEIIPYGYVNNCFYAMTSHGEADYFYLQSEKTDQINIDRRTIDLYVDIQKLEKILQKAYLSKK